MLDVGGKIYDVGCRMLIVERMKDMGCRIQDVECRIQNVECRIQDVRSRLESGRTRGAKSPLFSC